MEKDIDTILLVDDEASIRNVLSIALEDSGYTVITAGDGNEALRLFRENPTPIVLTDIKMPGMDGVELLDKIKSACPDTEVIMISGHGDMDLAIASLKRDATDFITKPINDDALEIALKRARERLVMKRQLRAYTEKLESLVEVQAARLVEIERVAAVSRTFEALSAVVWDMAADLEGGIRHFNEMPCHVSIHNADGNVIAANNLYRKRFGDRLGKPAAAIYKGDARDWPKSPSGVTFATGTGQRRRETVEYANGIETPVMVHTAPIKSSEGQTELVLEFSIDLGEIKRLTDQLAATRRSYQQLFDEVPCYITVQNRELTITAANRLFELDFGASLGIHCYAAYKHRETPCPDCPVMKTFVDGQSHQTEMTVTARSGDAYQVLISTAPLRDAAGRITGVMEMSTNITQIRQLQDHLSALGLKISSISHGIKGLLTGLDGGIYLVDSGFSKENRQKIEEGWEVVKQMVRRIRSMVLDILYFAKERELQWEEVEVARFARDTVEAIRRRAADNDIRLHCEFDESAGAIKIDPGVVRSALINILENAVDACVEDRSGRPKTIHFRINERPDDILFEVEDNGIGMDRETVDNLFSLFFSSKGNRGTGLGLYISSQIVKQHGGKIEVSSTRGRGSTFRIVLPKKPV